MRIARDRDGLDRAFADTAGTVAFVPTMGNLHAGHLALVKRAVTLAERVVVSIFVNPLQFGPGEDFESYPRTFDADREAIEAAGVDLLFAPTVDVMYPPDAGTAKVTVPDSLGGILEGASRPGHFDGVATVVVRLLELVRPDVAVFGEKDFQQLAVIRWLVGHLGSGVRIVGVPTVREADGLALSSRNQYLTGDERARAPAMYRALTECAAAVKSGVSDWDALAERGRTTLESAGFEPVYFEVRDADTLGPPDLAGSRVVLAAARLGRARLIDNVRVAPVKSLT